MQQYNAQVRKKSLLEQHAEAQAAAAAAAKKLGGKGNKGQKRPAEAPPDNDGMPWRPFDREKDLELKGAPRSGAQILKDASGLASRFTSGGSGKKNFL